MIHFLSPRTQDFAMRDFLELRGGSLIERVSIIHYEDLPTLRSLPAGSYIFSSLDQLTQAGLELVADYHRQLLAERPDTRCLNHPRATLGRLDLLQSLHRGGLNQHTAVRASESLRDLRFPVFVREENGHSGSLSGLLRSPEELERALAATMVRGYRLRDLLVVEFFDTVDSAGYYRKYAAMIVGDRIMPRGIAYGRQWMLKAEHTEFSEALLAEEKVFTETFPHRAQLEKIIALAQVGYGRIDYGVRDGVVETWEINTNPTIGAGRNRHRLRMSPELREMREPVRKIWTEGLIEAFRALDPGRNGEPPIPVTPSLPAPPPHRMVVAHDEEQSHGLVKRMLRPVKPLVLGVVRALSPLLLRLGRRPR